MTGLLPLSLRLALDDVVADRALAVRGVPRQLLRQVLEQVAVLRLRQEAAVQAVRQPAQRSVTIKAPLRRIEAPSQPGIWRSLIRQEVGHEECWQISDIFSVRARRLRSAGKLDVRAGARSPGQLLRAGDGVALLGEA